MKHKTISTTVRIPSYWQKWGINDIMVEVTADINDNNEEVYVIVKSVNFPGWHCMNFNSAYEFELIELVEQKCIDAYVNQMDFSCELYESIA